MKYKIFRKLIGPELSSFLFTYTLIKRQIAATLNGSPVACDNGTEIEYRDNFLDPRDKGFFLGTFGDGQVNNSYCCYSDASCETLLAILKKQIEKKIKKKLLPTYTYVRVYETGAKLAPHTDRGSCEISCTLNVGGDPWPIFLNAGTRKKKDIKKVILKPGDGLFFRGAECDHWREPFEGEVCGQIFLHYVEDIPKNQEYRFDGRLHLGLPSARKWIDENGRRG